MRIRRYFGAGIALFRKTINGYEIFLGKRCVKKGFGKWSIPGGGYEQKDNSFQCCASREFREEMGRTIPNGEILGLKTFNYPFFHWRTFIIFTAENMDKCWLSEFSEAKWIPINKIKNYKLCFGVKQEIKRFLQLERINKRTSERVAFQSDEFHLTAKPPLSLNPLCR